jgi:hypothetical protein
MTSVPRASIAKSIGRRETSELHTVDDALRRWLALS